jgi:PP-loop superfamily ATP-utilizing enzyme
LYESLHAVHRVSIEASPHSAQLYNGTNLDDLQDSTRVGLVAAQNFHVKSPLQQITKHQVRVAAKHLNLPNWNAAASPCLRSRLALGVKATQHHLQMIEQAERFIRSALLKEKLHAASNMRVRMLTNQRAMIEVDEDLLSTLTLGTVEQAYFESLGFSSVGARPFRTGSVARRKQTLNDDAVSVKDVDSREEMAIAVVG